MWIEKQGGQEGRGRKADAKHPVHPSPRNASILANLCLFCLLDRVSH
jgi:hypothetical protein